MIIYYDSYCQLCTNSTQLWKKTDWFNTLQFVSFRTLDDYPKLMEEQLHVYSNKQWYIGYAALIHIAKTLPLMWLLLPLMYMLKWIGLGDYIYKKVAKSRSIIPIHQCKEQCSLRKKATKQVEE